MPRNLACAGACLARSAMPSSRSGRFLDPVQKSRSLRASARVKLPVGEFHPMPLLSISALQKAFVSPDGERRVIVDVPQFGLEAGQQLALRGESGSGKTTFLHLIAGILAAGPRLDPARRAGHGQAEGGGPRPAARGGDRLHLPDLQPAPGLHLPGERPARACPSARGPTGRRRRPLLERVGLGHRLHHYPRQLSTGQQQRVAVARAMANRPKLVLADEPTGNLDHKNAKEALALIRETCRENGAALLLVSHDAAVLGVFEDSRNFDALNLRGQGGRVMTLALIVLRSLRQHLLSTVITALSIALAGGLLISVWVVKQQSQATFTQVNIGFDAVLGARGSKLQLVLNSIFHLEASPGNVSAGGLPVHQAPSGGEAGDSDRGRGQPPRLPDRRHDPGAVHRRPVRSGQALRARIRGQDVRPRRQGGDPGQFRGGAAGPEGRATPSTPSTAWPTIPRNSMPTSTR